jgi:hypothetical protein
MEELAKRYGITKPTLYAWKKHPKKNELYKAIVVKEIVEKLLGKLEKEKFREVEELIKILKSKD